ncbi:MAG TPA: flagellin, partial [Planctomycetes bacterium]|nr:flagellin [Planctomycetota bacterium]
MQINTNIGAMQALRNLNNTTFKLNKTLSRLSSGLRIATAADDPAGLIVSEQLRSQIASLKAASRNVTEGGKLFGIAEAALEEVNN